MNISASSITQRRQFCRSRIIDSRHGIERQRRRKARRKRVGDIDEAIVARRDKEEGQRRSKWTMKNALSET